MKKQKYSKQLLGKTSFYEKRSFPQTSFKKNGKFRFFWRDLGTFSFRKEKVPKVCFNGEFLDVICFGTHNT